ncbi:hypothetical protein LLB_1272 [Legionella longbeachae D-4968]|nr:hypothetical protein LLB_1272 [Legionella longbeachae D-4968]
MLSNKCSLAKQPPYQEIFKGTQDFYIPEFQDILKYNL